MELEIKHLAPYLPYGVQVTCTDLPNLSIYGVNTISEKILNIIGDSTVPINKLKLKLYPLTNLESDITKRIRRDQLSPYFWECYDMDGGIVAAVLSCPYKDCELLLSEHFDIFGLIPAGLAIDINTI